MDHSRRKIGSILAAAPLLAALIVLSVSPGLAAEPAAKKPNLDEALWLGDWKQSQTLFDRMIEQNPNDADVRVARAKFRFLTGKNAAALADCDAALAARPRYAPALAMRGALLDHKGAKEDARSDLVSYLAMTHGACDLATQTRRAAAWDSLADYTAARNEYKAIVRESVSARTPSDLYNRGQALLQLGRFKDALPIFKKLTQSCPGAPMPRASLAYCYVELNDERAAFPEMALVQAVSPDLYCNFGLRGWAFEKQKLYKRAIEQYTLALEIDDHYVYALRRRARCRQEMGNNDLALSDLNKALALYPDNTDDLFYRAAIYHTLGQYESGITDLNHMVSINSKNVGAWYELGHLQGHLSHYDEALAANNKALKLAPRDSRVVYGRAWLEREMGHKEKAREGYALALKLNPKDSSAYYSLAMLYREEKQYAKSIDCFTKAIAIYDKDCMYFCARASAEVRCGKYKEAIADCNKSLLLSPNRLHPYLSRGEAYAALGQYQLALYDLNHVIEYDTSNLEALQERAKVHRKLKSDHLAEVDLFAAKKLVNVAQKDPHGQS